MKSLNLLRRRLGWKLFLSYLLVLIIGVVVLDVTAELQTPRVLSRNITTLQAMEVDNPALVADLEAHLQQAVHDQLLIATLAGIIAAIAASLFTTRRILLPIQAMTHASQRISAGDYHERIDAPSQDELGEWATSFNQMAEALERTERRRLELIGDVAHELRTPLSGIKSSLEGLVDGVLPYEPDTFLGLQREVSRMQRLVHDLADLSRVEAGQVRLELRPVDFGELINAAAARLHSQFEDKDVTLCLDVPQGLPRVAVDTNRMTQVLLNLLGNSLHYTPSGGQVGVRAWAERGELAVAVQDSGIGIAPEHMPHIFERFYRVDKSRSRAGGGSGIGLTIAQHLVEAHGGHLWAASPGPGQGSTFTFTLPRPE
ncbi:MAG: ATP-binding protein [Anaerolineae bacterium]|nr:ATP-binding protein [Anaerolineae bacterium]